MNNDRFVTVYSKNDCGACGLVEQFFKGNDVDFKLINTDLPEYKEYKEYVHSNYMGFPVVEYKDIKFTGFDYGKLNQIVSEVSDG